MRLIQLDPRADAARTTNPGTAYTSASVMMPLGMAARVAANDTRQRIRDDNRRQYVSGFLASRHGV